MIDGAPGIPGKITLAYYGSGAIADAGGRASGSGRRREVDAVVWVICAACSVGASPPRIVSHGAAVQDRARKWPVRQWVRCRSRGCRPGNIGACGFVPDQQAMNAAGRFVDVSGRAGIERSVHGCLLELESRGRHEVTASAILPSGGSSRRRGPCRYGRNRAVPIAGGFRRHDPGLGRGCRTRPGSAGSGRSRPNRPLPEQKQHGAYSSVKTMRT